MAIVDNFSVEELQEIVSNSKNLQQVLKKLGYSSVSGANRKTVQSRLDKYSISTEHFNKGISRGIARTPENTFIKDSNATQAALRRLYLKGNYTPYVDIPVCKTGALSRSSGFDSLISDQYQNQVPNGSVGSIPTRPTIQPAIWRDTLRGLEQRK